MPAQPQQKPITVNDIVHSDPRVLELKKQYNAIAKLKNELILQISYIEADIIATMGAFEYLNAFTEVEEARAELMEKFRPLIVKKQGLIEEIASQDIAMDEKTKAFETLANQIVEDLKKAVNSASKVLGVKEGTPDECPTDLCTNCQYTKEYCKCEKEVEVKNGCPCGEGCDCAYGENQVCDHCQSVCDGLPRTDVEPPEEPEAIPGPEAS